MRVLWWLALALVVAISDPSLAAKKDKKKKDEKQEEQGPMSAGTFAGLKLREIGPGLMSGRIADLAIDSDDTSTWYVAVGSGGVWKTVNAGTTWSSIFDGQSSYSIGCVTIDPNNSNTIWVGTGENVGGRHVGFGDGIYRSADGGASWEHLGLKKSEHISKIIVHPENSDVVWVAAQGPLWSSGGERGVYMTEDGGKSWTQTLSEGEWTGVTDLVIDPREPNRLYAATWQRHRTIGAYMGGGPESGVHRSDDGGKTWTKLSNGLPSGNLGKIGLALSPQQPDVLYAAIEQNRRSGGIWRSTNRGASWEKRSDQVSGATGPHYYQELVASPHVFDRIYLIDMRVRVSEDGGSTFRTMNESDKHSDNHALVFRHDDPNYMLIGTDGGVYESYDLAKTWRFVANLPITQFYKLAVDDSEPFYNIYGGTQDNNTQGGPSRTDNVHGIRNADWFITLFGDGHQPAIEPGNPDIMYSQWQQGNLMRVDRTTGELTYIQPQPEAGDTPERFNWDGPILVSPHSPTRLYFSSQRLWRSDDRGDSWRALSGDLTRNEDRMLMPIMGRQQSWDSPWDMWAMSTFNTITSIAESPKQEGLIYIGTDDGLIQVTEDGGQNWRRIEVSSLPGVPERAYVNDIKADLFDANTVYVALDDHKSGNFKPYLLKSSNRGKSWTSIASDLPERHLVWRIVQDHVKPGLLFAGTEFGVFFTVDGGTKWVELTGGVPPIPFRDLAIQRRENDLVGATFGRGFFVLDDYSALREVSEEGLKKEAMLFPTRKAWWYIQRPTLGGGKRASQGSSYYVADNPPFGAVFTYHLAEGLKSKKSERQKAEKELIEEEQNTPRPSWEAIEQERRQADPSILLTVRDRDGNVVRRLTGPAGKGFHRVAWDLSFPSTGSITNRNASGDANEASGFMVAPGRYSVSLAKRVDGEVTELAGPMDFEVVQMRKGALKGASPAEVAKFWERLGKTQRTMSRTRTRLSDATSKVTRMGAALARSGANPGDLDQEIEAVRQELLAINHAMNGDVSKGEVGDPDRHTVGRRIGAASMGTSMSTYGPTPNLEKSLAIAERELRDLSQRLDNLIESRLPALQKRLDRVGAPYVSTGS